MDRSQYADAVEENNQRYQENQQLYRKRQEINEHIFGTIKRQWGYNHTNLIGLEKVNGEHSLIMLVYNIKRDNPYFCIMTPVELKMYFEQNPPPATFELKPWAKIIDMERFLHGAYMELSNFNGDYNNCPSYWRLKDLHKALTKKQDEANSEN